MTVRCSHTRLRLVASLSASLALVSGCGSDSGTTDSAQAYTASTTFAVERLNTSGSSDLVAHDGKLYFGTGRGIAELDEQTRALREFDEGAGEGLAIHDGTLYWGSANRLETLDLADGAADMRQIPDVNRVWGVAFDSSGAMRLGVADRNGTMNQILAVTGDSIQSVTTWETQRIIRDLTANPDGTLYAVDIYSNTIWEIPPNEQARKFERNGLTIPRAVVANAEGDLFVVTDDSRQVGTSSTAVRLLLYPAGADAPIELASYESSSLLVAVGEDGSVYYTSEENASETTITKLVPVGT